MSENTTNTTIGKSADNLIERQKLRRQATLWRALAVVLASALAVALVMPMEESKSVISSERVARVDIDGLIVPDRYRDEMFRELEDDDDVKAVLLAIDSPGGTVVGGEELYLAVKRLAGEKPVVAVMGGTATSAAYMAALGAERIVAREGTVTGSIGVIMQSADLTGLLEKLGIKPEVIKSGPFKAQPNPLEPLTPEVREATRLVIADMFEMFRAMVAEGRGMDPEKVARLADGRIFTGRQALANGLIDAIGGEREAVDWLVEKHGIDPDTPVKEAKPDYPKDDWAHRILGQTGKALFSERLKLDGALSVWHPEM